MFDVALKKNVKVRINHEQGTQNKNKGIDKQGLWIIAPHCQVMNTKFESFFQAANKTQI